MPTKPTQGNDGAIRSQKDRRYPDTFFDQHKSTRFPNGRPWWGEREFLSGSQNPSLLDPFIQGELGKGNHDLPGQEWDAPWVPLWNGGGDRSFYEFDYMRKRVRIRYDRVIANDKEAYDKYFMAAAKLSAANGWGEVKYGQTPSFQITSVLFDPPRSPKIAQAAQAGDPWLLGLSDEPNDELARLLGITTMGMRTSYVPAVPAQVEKVLGASNEDLVKLIANVVTATLDAREAERKAQAAERMAHARRHKKPKADPMAA